MNAFPHSRTMSLAVLIVTLVPVVAGAWVYKEWKSGIEWPVPPVVTPGQNGSAPSDAFVLFDGNGVDQWEGADRWLSKDGTLTATKRTITTKKKFGSCQLHLEFASPEEIKGEGQGRGNSGIFFGGSKYEVQVLDSFENETYPDGQCGALYKQSPPIVNPCRKPGEWQTYDIIYDAPEFGAYGEVLKPTYLTVLLNGVLVQNHVELKGNTFFFEPPTYDPHEPKQSISLQFHKNPVKFRNIWVRENVSALQPQLPEESDFRWREDDFGNLKKRDKPGM